MTAPLSVPGDPIEAGVFKNSNREEDIDLVRNQGMEVDGDIKPDLDNVPLVDTPTSKTLIEGHTLRWYDIDRRGVVAQNYN